MIFKCLFCHLQEKLKLLEEMSEILFFRQALERHVAVCVGLTADVHIVQAARRDGVQLHLQLLTTATEITCVCSCSYSLTDSKLLVLLYVNVKYYHSLICRVSTSQASHDLTENKTV